VLYIMEQKTAALTRRSLNSRLQKAAKVSSIQKE